MAPGSYSPLHFSFIYLFILTFIFFIFLKRLIKIFILKQFYYNRPRSSRFHFARVKDVLILHYTADHRSWNFRQVQKGTVSSLRLLAKMQEKSVELQKNNCFLVD